MTLDLSHIHSEGTKSGCQSPNIINGNFVRCGKVSCDHCKSVKRKYWLGRLAAEAFTADAVRFVTLTYNEKSLDARAKSLDPEHFKDYSKVRRKKWNFRHFSVGEYGDANGRPHWHSLQFYYGEIPDDILGFSTENYGWAKGNSEYELPRSIAGTVAYIYDYVDKGGKQLRPSPGIGKRYLLNYARHLARNGHRLTNDYGIRYTVPNARKSTGGLWSYQIPNGHPWAAEMADHYIEEWEMTRSEKLTDPLRGINYGDRFVCEAETAQKAQGKSRANLCQEH